MSEPRPESGPLSRPRRELMSVYAALADEKEREQLRTELDRVAPGVLLDVKNPWEMLKMAAEQWQAKERPLVHPLHLAYATMAVLRWAPDAPGTAIPDLSPILNVLSGPDKSLPSDGEGRLLTALRDAAGVDRRERWRTLVREAGDLLSPELTAIRASWCKNGLREQQDEFVARVETRLVIAESADILDSLARALLPDNWSVCNDFFCSLQRRAERDAACRPPTTGGNLVGSEEYWRGVYQERVGGCPDGWFPDTYLLFTWYRSRRQIVLRYELAPRAASDESVLRVDEGYVQVDRVGPTYEVSTVKYLLFDDALIPGGGQTLGRAACPLGWLDYSINQFTTCASQLSGATTHIARTVDGGQASGSQGQPGGLEAELLAVLRQYEAGIRQSASETDAQLTRIIGRIRDGQYGLDAGVIDAGELVTRAIRDGARSALGYTDLLREYADLIRAFTRRGEGGR